MRAAVLAFGLSLLAGAALAADLPQYAPAPAWVKPIPIPDKGAGADPETLLQVSQARFTNAGDDLYDEWAERVREAGDLTRLGNVVLSWSPDTETLVIHKIELIRDGKVIDQLDQGKKVVVLHRETNLEKAMFDGTLTATVQLDGLQVGDVIHVVLTRQVHDPVLKGHSQHWTGLERPGKTGRAYLSASWPSGKAVKWRGAPGIVSPTETTSKAGDSLVIDLTDAEAPLAPRGAPARFGAVGFVQMSDFASWADVSALMAPLFDTASTLEPDSPLKAEIAKIKAQSSDPAVQAAAALKLVQDRIRYLFVGLNNGNLVPAKADDTWRRRFGDCKAKTALLLALLKGLGIQAQPALVDTRQGDALPGRLPSLSTFDHVAIKAKIAGKTYWLDGTRLGDESLDRLETPNYHWMLPVQASGAQLEELKPEPYTEAHFSAHLDVDASAGLDAPAKVHGEHQWRADQAEGIRLRLQTMSSTERERTIRGYWQQAEPWANAATVSMTDDGQALTLVMDGSATISWGVANRGRTYVVNDSGVGGEANFQRQPGPNADAPFAVDFPVYREARIKVKLPDNGAGFALINAAPIDQVVAGAQYRRTARIEDGAVVIDIEMRTVAQEFPFADGTAAAATLRNWGMHTVMIAFNTALSDAQAKNRACLSGPPDDVLKACQAMLAMPAEQINPSAIYYNMARAYLGKGDPPAALDALSKALSLRPDFADALAARGALLVDKGDLAAAAVDLDKATSLQPNHALALGARAYLHMRRREFDQALADADKSIAADSRNAVTFVTRGSAHLELHDLAGAEKDYDEALRLAPDLVNAHVAKGELLLQQKAFAPAEKEFDRAIELRPKMAINWMDRGLARAAQKRWSDAITDYNEAVRLDPSNAQIYRNRAIAYLAQDNPSAASADTTSAASAARVQPPPALPIPPVERPTATTADRVRALLASGRAHVARREYGPAFDDFDQALAITPNDPNVLMARGDAFYALNNWDKALADYDAYVAVRPTEPVGHMKRGLVYLDRKDWARAIAENDEALKVNPDYPAALNNRGFAYYSQKDPDKAIADYDAALKLNPDSVLYRVNRGNAQIAKKAYAEALKDFDFLTQKEPAVAGHHYARGVALFGLHDNDKAIDELDQAVRLGPPTAQMLTMRASVHLQRGEFEQAIDDCDSALVVAPSYAPAFNTKSQAERRLGKISEANADLAKAKAAGAGQPL